MEELVQAVQGLENDANNRNQWNNWLQEFQRKPEAWQVCYDVLTSSSLQAGYKIFAAQTLRNKVAYDLRQLPAETHLQLKDRILDLLEKNQSETLAVSMQLCVALSAVAMQVREWTNVAGEMIQRLGNMDKVDLLYEFLKVLPDEFSASRYNLIDRHVRAERTRQVITDAAPTVLNFVMESASAVANQDKHILVLEVLQAWVREVNPIDMVSSPIMDWLFDALPREDFVEVAAESIATIIETTGEDETVLPQASEIMLRRLASVSFGRTDYADSDLLHAGMTKVYTSAVLAWHVQIAQKPQEYGFVFLKMVECLTMPDTDPDLIRLSFFPMECIHQVVLVSRYQKAREMLSGPILDLIIAYTKFFEYPPGQENEQIFASRNDEEQFRERRYEIGDILKYCCDIIGGTVTLYTYLQMMRRAISEPGSVTWQQMEASLFAIRVVARYVRSNEVVLAEIFDLFAYIPTVGKVFHAAVLVIGRYSAWTSAHPELVEFQLGVLVKGLFSDDRQNRSAAAHAFMYFATDCGRFLAPQMATLVPVYNGMRAFVDGDSLGKLGAGLGHIVAHLNNSDMAQALRAVGDPLMLKVTAVLDNIDQASEETKNILGEEISAYASIIAALPARISQYPYSQRMNHPVSQVIRVYYDKLLDLLHKLGPSSPAIAEGVAHLFLYAITVVGGGFYDLTPRLLQELAMLSQQTVSARVYELSGMIGRIYFNERNESRDCLVNRTLMESIWEFNKVQIPSLLATLQSAPDLMTVDTAVLERGLYYLSDVLMVFAPDFVASEHFEAVTATIIRALLCDSPAAQNAAEYFLDELATYAVIPPEAPERSQELAGRIRNVLRQLGPQAIENVFEAYLYVYSDYPRSTNIVMDVFFHIFQQEAVAWTAAMLDRMPGGTLSDEEKQTLLTTLTQTMGQSTDMYSRPHGCGVAIYEFLNAYKQRVIMPR